jgi:DNA-binding MarR family transcriptional regulator
VFLAGAILGRAGYKRLLRFSQAWGGILKHKALIDAALHKPLPIAPLLAPCQLRGCSFLSGLRFLCNEPPLCSSIAVRVKDKKGFDSCAQVVHIHTMSTELDMSAMENCVCFNLRWVTRKVTQFFDAEMRRHGIRPTQGSILRALNAKENWSMAELSDWLGMDRTTLVRNLRPLQRDGLVQAAGGGRGGRVEVSITAKGRKKIEECLPAWRSAQSAAVKTLGEQRWSAILSDLETAALALNK